MKFDLDPEIAALVPQLVEDRRHFHCYPELYYQEFESAKMIAARLESLGFEVRTGVGGTGVVGLLRGNGDRTLAFRADMDALAVHERNQVEYRSRNDGVMHACGHDGHMAILLGLARGLSERAEPFPGNVKLIFQPAEEGHGGAVKMIEQGVLENPKPDAIVGLHLWNYVPIGTVGVSSGPVMAAVDGFEIRIRGKGGHSAAPHTTVDPVIVASQMTLALQTIVSRNVDPLTPAVLSVTKIEAGSADNAVPDSARLRGLFRTYDPELRSRMPQMIERCAKGTAEAFGASIEIDINPMYPATVCDPAISGIVEKAALSVLNGKGGVVAERTMGSEDMSYYLEKVPGCFFFVGSANAEKGLDQAHHHPKFDFDESALGLGVAIFAKTAELWFASKD